MLELRHTPTPGKKEDEKGRRIGPNNTSLILILISIVSNVYHDATLQFNPPLYRLPLYGGDLAV
jgi:hypothetical protein